MKVYISGPITNTTDYMERFAKAEEELTNKGCEVINPAKVNAMLPKSTSYQGYIDMSLCMLKQADCIYLLKNWVYSKGATLERAFALSYGIRVCYEEDGFDK